MKKRILITLIAVFAFVGLTLAGEAILSASKRRETLRIRERGDFDFLCEFLIAAAAAIGGGVLFGKREALSAYVHTLWMDEAGLMQFLKFLIPAVIAFFALFFCYSRGVLRRERFGLMLLHIGQHIFPFKTTAVDDLMPRILQQLAALFFNFLG